jgi:hypothetical protein
MNTASTHRTEKSVPSGYPAPIETILASHPVHLAVNVHSLSECSLASIEWWLDLLRKHRVRYFLLVPNADAHCGTMLLSRERDGSKLDMLPSITSRGYQLVIREPKFKDPDIQRHGISPTHHYLFELYSAERFARSQGEYRRRE